LRANPPELVSKGACPALDLFSAANLAEPFALRERKSQIAKYLDANPRNFLGLDGGVVAAQHSCNYAPIQYLLPLAEPPRSSVVTFLSRDRYGFLDYGVHDTFYSVPNSAAAARKLERQGIYVLGQLVQMSEANLRRFPFMNDSVVEAMKKQLAKIGLMFNVRAPAWNKSYRGVLNIAI
jgi:hypothetical protein